MEFYLKKIAPNGADIPNPFANIGNYRDWRSHIPKQLRDTWLRFSLRERLLMAIIAQESVDMAADLVEGV